jgi:hypothetical protein
MRNQLEIKLAACLATGGINGHPIQPHRVKNPKLRAIIAAGMLCKGKGWSVKDLLECHGGLDGASTLALMATSEKPIWGASDYYLFDVLETLEEMQSLAYGGGRAL